MKYRLRGFIKKNQVVTTEKKTFVMPYFDCIAGCEEPCIIEVENPENLMNFLEEFNSWASEVQIEADFIET